MPSWPTTRHGVATDFLASSSAHNGLSCAATARVEYNQTIASVCDITSLAQMKKGRKTQRPGTFRKYAPSLARQCRGKPTPQGYRKPTLNAALYMSYIAHQGRFILARPRLSGAATVRPGRRSTPATSPNCETLHAREMPRIGYLTKRRGRSCSTPASRNLRASSRRTHRSRCAA